MKTKRFRLLTVLLTAVMLVALSLNVMAAKSNAVTQDGLTAQLFTDKDSYKAGESVKASVQVDNHTGSEVFIFSQINVPEGVKLANESAAFDAHLQDGETWITPGGVTVSAGSAAAGAAATGDNMQAGFYVILTALAVGGIFALLVYGKNRKTWLSIMLCIVMVGGLVTFAVPVEAADTSGEISLSCTIQVDGKAKEVEANVSYVIYDEAEEVAEESTEATTPSEPIEESSETSSDASEESSEASSDASEESSEASGDASEESSEASGDASEESSEASSDASEESSEASSDASEESSEPVEEDEFDVYVDASFTGTSTGRKSAPYTTIQQAVEAVRALNDNMTEDIVVYIADGEYYVDEVIALGAEDGGSNGFDVIYKAESVAGVRLYGAEALTGWTEYQDEIWSVAVEDDFYTLYEDDRRAIKARYPNREYDAEYTTSKAPYLRTIDTDSTNNQTIKYNTADLSGITFADIEDANIVIWPWDHRDHAHYTLNIVNIDTENGIITPNILDGQGYGLNARYYIEGMLELLDTPGEFHYDSGEGKLYYMPMNGGNPNEDFTVYAPATHEIFHVTDAQNIVFDGISFEKTDFVKSMKIWYDHLETRVGAVTLENTNNVEIRNCRFKNNGLNGVWITGESRNNTIDSCLFENIGINAVLLRGDRPNAYKIKDNVISNCLMHDMGELSVECGGVTIMSTQGTIVENCEIYNSPRNAVSIRGDANANEDANSDNLTQSGQSKDNIVRNCLIYETNQDSGDTGALHTAGVSFNTANGNTNYFENIYIDNVVAHPSMKDFKPNGYFGDFNSNHQSFKNIKITNTESEYNGVITDQFTDSYQIRYNQSDAKTGIYENVSWAIAFKEKELDFVNMGLREDFPIELTADYSRVKQAIILQVGSEAVLVNGLLEDAGVETVKIDGTVLVPIHVLLSALGLDSTQVNLSLQTVNGQEMTSLDEVEKLGLDANNYGGLIVISEKADLFDGIRDDMTIKRLGNYLFENYQAKNFKYDVIESVYTDYTLTGIELKDGESYMVRSEGSWNATSYAVSKKDSKVRLVIKEDKYSIPVYQELNTTAASVSFVKEAGKLKIMVDGTEVYCTDNPFDAVYYGTYTESGTNTLNAVTNGMSILPEKATSLGIVVGTPQIKLDSSTRYYVNLRDEAGNSYDLTTEGVVVTSSDETVVKCENGYVIPVAYGSATLTATATIDGIEMTATVSIEVTDDLLILFSDDFTSGASSSWVITKKDENDSVTTNDAGQLVIHDGSKASDATKNQIEARVTLPEKHEGEVLSFEYDFTPVEFGSGDTSVGMYIYQDGAQVVAAFAHEGYFSYYLEDGSGFNKFAECKEGTTYHIKMVTDPSDKTVDFYVDGELIKENVPWRKQQRTYANSIGFMSNNNSIDATFIFDNVVISKENKTTSLFNDDFTAGVSSSWVITKKDENDSVTTNDAGQLVIHDGSKATDATKNQIEARVTLPEKYEGEVLSFEYDFTPVEFGSGDTSVGMYIYQDGAQVVAAFAHEGYFSYYLEDGSGFNKFAECKEGTTYHIKMVTDPSDKTVDFYVDGELIKENVPWRKQQRTYANSIGFMSNANSIEATYIFDNVVISKENKTPSLFNDDFTAGVSSSWVITKKDENDSVTTNDAGQLVIYDGSKASDATKNQIEARVTLPEKHEGEVLSFEYDFTPVDFGSGDTTVGMYIYQDGAQVVAAFVHEGYFSYYLEDGSAFNHFAECKEGTTYHIKMVTDPSDKTVDFYVDGKLIKENVPWRKQQRTYANSIGFMSNANSIEATYIFDNVVITKVN